LEVSDNGIGIPEDQIANLFKMFFKVKSEHPGSGLGLYILKQVVDSLGGRIAVTSILKKGSTFTVYLPK
jgi:signal transduction histidine kinase